MNTYNDREQTLAKHFILRRYLQALAFKVLRAWDITYIDGFSGPWESRTGDFSDTSFMIAIDVLKDAQKRLLADSGIKHRIRCFFAETDASSYAQLSKAVAPHNDPANGFEVETFHGKFEDAVPQIIKASERSFPLIFIDPTGWSGYPFQKIRPIFSPDKCEVLINFMYDFVNRFVASNDPTIVASLDPILGGPNWKDRLDKTLPLGEAAEKLFRETLKKEGKFQYVISTRIDRGTADRPHFYLAYGTKSRDGLKAFRQTEYDALREHAKNRANAKDRKREEKTGSADLFAGENAKVSEAGIDQLVDEQKRLASDHLLKILKEDGAQRFSFLVDTLLQTYMLRETNVKDICVDLAKQSLVKNTWGNGTRKPTDESIISLV